MQNVKVALLLAASMMTFLLAGCGSNQVTTENTGSSTTDLIAGFRISFLFWSWRFLRRSREHRRRKESRMIRDRDKIREIFVWGSPEWNCPRCCESVMLEIKEKNI